jgi:hypothetical protein
MRFISLGVNVGEEVIRFAARGDWFYTNFKSLVMSSKGGKYIDCEASAGRSLKAYFSGYLEDMARQLSRTKTEDKERIELMRASDATEFSTHSQETLLLRELYLHKEQYSSVYLPNVRYNRIVYTPARTGFEVAYSPPELHRRRSVGSAVHFIYAIKERRKDISSAINLEQHPMFLI